MAVVTDTQFKRGSGRQPKDHQSYPVSSVEVTLRLTPEEAACLPTPSKMRRLFGPAKTYSSQVYGHAGSGGAELVIQYRMADKPFGTANAELVSKRAQNHVTRVLLEERRRREATGSGGN